MNSIELKQDANGRALASCHAQMSEASPKVAEIATQVHGFARDEPPEGAKFSDQMIEEVREHLGVNTGCGSDRIDLNPRKFCTVHLNNNMFS